MTKRAEVLEEQQRTHSKRALTMVGVCFTIAIVYTVFILLMVTHMPRVLEDALASGAR